MGRGERGAKGVTSAKGLLYGARPRGPGPPDIKDMKFELPKKPRNWVKDDNHLFAFLQDSGYIAPGNYNFVQGINGSIGGRGTASFEIAEAGSSEDETVPVTSLTLRHSDGRLGVTIRHREQRDRGYIQFEPIDRGQRQVESADQLTDDLVAHGKEIGLDYVERHLTYKEIKSRLGRGERLEIVWGEDDEPHNSSDKILQGAIEQANRYNVSYDEKAINQLTDELKAVDPQDTSAYVKVLNQSELGRQVLTGDGGAWIYRILIDRDQE